MVHYLAWAYAGSRGRVVSPRAPNLGVDGTLFNIQNVAVVACVVFAHRTWGSATCSTTMASRRKGYRYVTTSHGRHIAFAFYINLSAGKSSVDLSKDAGHYAGETLGEMATDTYLTRLRATHMRRVGFLGDTTGARRSAAVPRAAASGKGAADLIVTGAKIHTVDLRHAGGAGVFCARRTLCLR